MCNKERNGKQIQERSFDEMSVDKTSFGATSRRQLRRRRDLLGIDRSQLKRRRRCRCRR